MTVGKIILIVVGAIAYIITMARCIYVGYIEPYKGMTKEEAKIARLIDTFGIRF